jgi:hypothetical protein
MPTWFSAVMVYVVSSGSWMTSTLTLLPSLLVASVSLPTALPLGSVAASPSAWSVELSLHVSVTVSTAACTLPTRRSGA